MDMGDLLRAIELASIKHRDQRRKDAEQSPYINHPIAVASLLAKHGVTDRAAILGAILHDTIEDTQTTRDELAAGFGEDVASVVVEVTDDKSLPKARRKELQVEHAPHLSRCAQLVKLADKICNLRDITDRPPVDWPLERRREYVQWTKRVVDGLRGVHAELAGVFDAEHARGLGSLD
jgi:guanosine-3',5'-bis(diphosphate) 3'-pyrophosphohydrolase